MTTAYARRIGLDANGLWSIARGFARYQNEYYAALAAADEPRRSALDGRGNLSLRGLEAWCDFVVRVAREQIEYMRSLLKPDTLADRLRVYSAYRTSVDANVRAPYAWRIESGDLLVTLVSRGALPRRDALAHFPKGERTARAALAVLLNDGILEADSHRADVRLGFPPHAATILFPDLMTKPDDGP